MVFSRGAALGGDAPIVVQLMTNTDTRDAAGHAARRSTRLAEAGCEIVRVAIPHADALDGFEAHLRGPARFRSVADIHFDHRLAIEAARRGAAKLRINPGNIGIRHALTP